jgi:hypothetical protein
MGFVQRQTVKIIHLFLAAFLVVSPATQAAENRYDVLSKLLTPFTNLLAKAPKGPNRAVSLSARVEKMTGLPEEMAGSKVEIALQSPDRLLLRGPILGAEVTVCRDRQQVWVTPGSSVKTLLDLAIAQKKLPPVDPSAKLGPFELPVADKQLAFLPALFAVKDAGSEDVDGEPCRVLDLTLMPELAKSLKDKDWAARVWVRPEYKPARLLLRRTGWELAVKFDRVDFQPTLPDTAWQPAMDDVLQLDAPRFRQLIGTVVK